MPRLGRLHIPGGCYHIMGRGLERRRIFNEAEDKSNFLDRLGVALSNTGAQCLAWALMSNHYHLLIRVGEQPLSKLMSPLLGGYALAYNRRKRRVGYVFQNRYKSILCDEDAYLLELVRYIHLNPIRARMLQSLEQLDGYLWTGHASLVSKSQQAWQSTDEILGCFAKRVHTARKRYREFIADGMSLKLGNDLSGGGLVRSYGGWDSVKALRKEHVQRVGDERILGESDFVERVLKEDALKLKEKANLEHDGWNLERLVQVVCHYCEVDVLDLRSKGRANQLSLAKGLICYWGTHHLGLTTHVLAGRLGISQPAASQSSARGRKYCLEHDVEMTDIS